MTSERFTDPRDPLKREAVDAMLTAHALDQLEGDERDSAERLLADPLRNEERRMVDEIRQMAALLRAGRTEDDLHRSAAIRRAVVAAMSAAGSDGASAEATPPVVAVALRPVRRSVPRSVGRWFAIGGSLAAAAFVLVTASVTRLWELQPPMVREVAQRAAARPSEPSAPTGGNQLQRQDELAAAGPMRDGKESDQLKRRAGAPTAEKMAGGPAPGKKSQSAALDEAAFPHTDVDAAVAAAAKPMPMAARKQIAAPMFAGNGMDAAGLGDFGLQRERSSFMARGLQEQEAGERYERFSDNRVSPTSEQPLSTFSIDVDTASYANVRRFLTSGRLPPPAAVRIEEMVNYFRYDYPQPEGERPFSVTVEAAECPWITGRRLVRIGLQGRDIDRRERPAGNLVFLIDVSGSMGDANKLPLVKQALAMLVEELTENDSVAIVTYAGDAGLKLPPTSGDQKQKLLAVIESLSSGGSTHGSAGINLAYEQAAERFIPGGVNRVILATDGDLNVGVTSDEALVDLIRQKAAGGTFLTVLGFGEGNLQDAKMEKIADNGNGVYAYIDGAREARKVLVEQLTGSTITIAKDVKIQVEFNPTQVASYRLLGYENRIMAAEDFRNDRKDAGEIGAGHSVTVLYEIELVGDGGAGPAGAEPLKYQPAQPKPAREAALVDGETSRELLTVKLRWKKPDGDASTLDEVPLVDRGGAFEQASADLRFAGAVAAFGMVLRNSEYKGEATLPQVAKIAAGALGPDRGGYRAEFLDLVRKAETLRDGGR